MLRTEKKVWISTHFSMNYSFRTSDNFYKEAKTLHKKYKSLKDDLAKLRKEIENGTATMTDLGGGFYKIRMSITSKGQGKSGRARVITYETLVLMKDKEEEKRVVFVSIYDKSEFDTIDVKLLKANAKEIQQYAE